MKNLLLILVLLTVTACNGPSDEKIDRAITLATKCMASVSCTDKWNECVLENGNQTSVCLDAYHECVKVLRTEV